MGEYFTSVVLQAYLSGAWVDLSADWLIPESTSVEWGINGIGPLDVVSDIGEMRFSLKNPDGKYYPDGGAPLAGWGTNTKVRLIFTYASVSKVFLYYVEDIKLIAGMTTALDRVQVTALDWMKFANNKPILAPNIQLDKRADEGIQTILTAMTQPPLSYELQAGVNTFPVIFNGVGLRTVAYSEFAKLTLSEFGTLALLKDATNGEKLKLFNYTNSILAGEVSAYIDGEITDAKLTYRDNIINRAITTAYPKKVDNELKVLYSLDKPMKIKGGETITFRAKYTDPAGGSKINAIVESMQTP